MRISRSVIATSFVTVALVAPMTSPARADTCLGDFQAAIENPPPRPSPSQIVNPGPPLTIDGNVVRDYALAVSDHFSDATTAYAICAANATVDGVIWRAGVGRGTGAPRR